MILLSCVGIARPGYDLVVVGGTPGGIMAAIAAAREGKNSVILERSSHIGGLPVNGLGATDINTRAATTGLFREFVEEVRQYYVDKYGADSPQVKDCSGGFHFEPSVAGKVFDRMLEPYKGRISVFTLRQFDCDPANVEMVDDRILGVRVTNRATGRSETYRGEIFLDATYEGDLGAAAGVPFRVGREGRDEFGEPGAGRIYKYWSGPVAEGSDGQGDNAVQAYNYRLCLTDDPANRVAIERPKNYNREEYVSLIEDVWTGRNTHVSFMGVTPEMMEENRRAIEAGEKTRIPGDKWGIAKITNMVTLPNRKTDANNQHLALISTDLPEENWPWPTSSWEWRDRFADRLRDYTLGLLWFAQNDEALPAHFREAASQWGLAADEYLDNGHFPRQVYVREGRRFEGLYFFTAKDALPVEDGQRPPIHESSVTASHYSLDSHAVRKREKGRVHLDGFFGITDARVYTVPYGVMVPREVDNLLLPVPVSGSHVGFSTLRMEPCWMALGQAAGIAASLTIDNGIKVRNLKIEQLQRKLVEQKATLIYYEDVAPDDEAFEMVQILGVAGYLPGWEARLSEAVSEADLAIWRRRSGMELDVKIGSTSRGEVLKMIYENKTGGCPVRK